MRLAIIGGRDFADEKLLDKTLKEYFCHFDDFAEFGDGYMTMFEGFVSGGAQGADILGQKWVEKWNKDAPEEFKVKITIFKPEYDKYPGKVAPLKRNETIIENADFVLAFWNGTSTGTANALGHAKRLKKPTMIIYY